MSNNAAILPALLAWQAVSCLAAPTPNVTATPVADPGWKREPTGRGTFSIIFSSVLTLGLCVWTAIHPNVKPNASTWMKVRDRLLFVTAGILVPEFILAVAFYEWREARKFHRKWCKLYGIEPGSEQDTLRMSGAFFVTMGGVSMAPAHKIPSNIFNILSTEAYLKLARTNIRGEYVALEKIKYLPQAAAKVAKKEIISETGGFDYPDRSEPEEEPGSLIGTSQTGNEPQEEDGGKVNEDPEELEMIIKRDSVHYRDVKDKGKAEILGKTLVVVQAVWILIQCVVRKASGLPITLLEIHVSMHVICAIGMYAFWFNKPQDVAEPVPISVISDLGQLCIEITAQNTSYRGNSNLKLKFHSEVESISLSTSTDYAFDKPSPTTRGVRFIPQGVPVTDIPAVAGLLIVPYNHTLDLGHFSIHNTITLERGEAWMPFEDLQFFLDAAKTCETGKRPRLPQVSLLRRVITRDAGAILDDIDFSNMYPACFILLAYGACHAAAWNTHFPSPVECLLWRISSIAVSTIPTYSLFLMVLRRGDYYVSFDIFSLAIPRFLDSLPTIRIWFPYTRGISLKILPKGIILLAVILPMLFGRLYLFIESFLSLRSLPYGSFDSTPWEDYYPHF